MTETQIDKAHTRMEQAPNDDNLRLAFFERLADAELFLLLDRESEGEMIDPRIIKTEEGRFVLVFDREERLSAFAEGPAPYAALSGRRLAAMLADQEIGIGLNLGVARSEILLPPSAVAWLNEALSEQPVETTAHPESFLPPSNLPEALLATLDTKLASASGLADSAYLAAVEWSGGTRGHLLAFVDPLPGAEPALANAMREALVFSGIEAGALDVTFLRSSDPAAARLAKVGLRFDLPKAPATEAPSAPGSDPERPPRLR